MVEETLELSKLESSESFNKNKKISSVIVITHGSKDKYLNR